MKQEKLQKILDDIAFTESDIKEALDAEGLTFMEAVFLGICNSHVGAMKNAAVLLNAKKKNRAETVIDNGV